MEDSCKGKICWSGIVTGPDGTLIPVEECPNKCAYDSFCGTPMDCNEGGMRPPMAVILSIIILITGLILYMLIRIHCCT